MTTFTARPPAPRPPFRPTPPANERLPGSRWSQVKVTLTVLVALVSTVAAIVLAFHAPVVSPVSPVSPAAASVPAPGSGLLDMIGDFGVMRGNRGGGRGR
jgi:hypothetical protein